MKFFIMFLGLSFFSSAVMGQSVVADGQVFYRMPEGEIVYRTVSLEVPSRGQGDVVLRGENSPEGIVADRFWSVEKNGRVIFYVAFQDPPGSDPGTIAVWRGTYTRGTNQAAYYGDVFVKRADASTDISELDESILDDDARYSAGFWFVAPIGE